MIVRVLLVIFVSLACACGGPTEPTSQSDQLQEGMAGEGQPVAQPAKAPETKKKEEKVAPPLPLAKPTQPAKVPHKQAADQPPKTQPAKTPPADRDRAAKPRVSVARQAGGEPVLLIDCPWQKYPRPSIQITLVLDDKVDLASLQPLPLDGIAASSLWERQIGSLNKPAHASSREIVKNTTAFIEYADGKLLTHRARENSLGKPSAYALDEELGTLLVFYRLESWADDRGVFRLALGDIDLASKFSQPGRIRVWLLSEEKVVLSATVVWPGEQPEKKIDKQPADQPPAEKKQPPPKPKPEVVKPKTVPKPVLKAPKPKADAPKTWAAPKQTGPVITPADTKPTLPPTDKPPAKVDFDKMTIDELANYIEQTWGPSMSKQVRKSWTGAWYNYYQVKNPWIVRRAVFLSLLKSCHKDQPPGKLRDAFAALYFKLKKSDYKKEKK